MFPLSPLILKPPAFDPKKVAGLGLNLDATQRSTLWTTSGMSANVGANSDPIGRWLDASGSGKDGVQVTAGSRPLYKLAAQGTLPGVYFDGATYVNFSPGVSEGAACTWFVVARPDPAPIDVMFLTTGAVDSLVLSVNASLKFALRTVDGGEITTVGAALSTTTASLLTGYVDNVASTTRVNGAAYGSGDVSAVGDGLIDGIGNDDLQATPSGWFVGYIHQVLAYTRTLTAAEIAYVEAGLNKKWRVY